MTESATAGPAGHLPARPVMSSSVSARPLASTDPLPTPRCREPRSRANRLVNP